MKHFKGFYYILLALALIGIALSIANNLFLKNLNCGGFMNEQCPWGTRCLNNGKPAPYGHCTIDLTSFFK